MSNKLILIGASTGGPGHLDRIFRALPGDFEVPVVIAQHINEQFLPTLCESLSQASAGLRVKMAEMRAPLERGGYMTHRGVNRFCKEPRPLMLDRSIACGDHAPSIDELFFSARALLEQRVEVLAVLLTGIGHDGAEGLSLLRQAGALTLAESEESAIVYGMPRAAIEQGAAMQVLNLDGIIGAIGEFGR